MGQAHPLSLQGSAGSCRDPVGSCTFQILLGAPSLRWEWLCPISV